MAAEPGPDLSPAPEPDGLLVIGRVNKPESIVSAVGVWTHLPLPGGRVLVSSVADEAVADVVDLAQPIDAAVSLTNGDVKPLAAYAVAVTSFEDAKVKLGARHRLSPGSNGQLKVDGLGRLAGGGRKHSAMRSGEDGDTDADEDEGCVLAPAAPSGARLVCGKAGAIEALAPYLTRTMPRQKWSSDLHVEVRTAPVKKPLAELRAGLPMLARGLLGSSSKAIRDLADASVGEVVDFVNDAQQMTIDAQVADSGIVATTRVDYQSQKSVIARMTTAGGKADAPPPAFWHLPGDTDLAFFGRGSDPKLFEHPRELLSNALIEAVEAGGMPEGERKALRDLVGDRTLALFTTGQGIYAKGSDHDALAKAVDARTKSKTGDLAADAEAKRVLLEQVVGWHLYQVSEPIAKVGPILKDWSTLWNRPAFAAWAKSKASAKTVARVRVAPAPAGVSLPKDTVHLEITIPREDLEEASAQPQVPAPPSRGNNQPVPKAAAPKAKKIPRKPVVLHIFAVPDGGATWLAFGLDGKLVAQKAATSLAQAPDVGTLGKTAMLEPLREGKMNGAAFVSLRGLLGVTAMDRGSRSPFALLDSLPNKGNSPLLFTVQAEASPSSGARASAVSTFRLPRGSIEDGVKLIMAH